MADLGAIGYDETMPEDSLPVLAVRVAPPPLNKTVSGIVYNAAGSPTARTVRAYRRSDGLLLDETISDAGTGAYSLDCTADEVQRVVLDDDAGSLYNDLVDRVVPG